MPKLRSYILSVGMLLSLLLFLSVAYFVFAAETLTIDTYYPSPYGVYDEMRARRIAVGDNYSLSSYCWPPAVCANLIDSNADLVVEGNVGIGTASPAYTLHVYDTTGSLARLEHGGATGNAVLEIKNSAIVDGGGQRAINFLDGTNNAVAQIAVHNTNPYSTGSSGYAQSIMTFNTSGASGSVTRMSIDQNGKVGIGTPVPAQKLHIYDTGLSQVTIEGGSVSNFPLLQLLDDATGNGWNIEHGREGDNILGFYRGETKMAIDNSGNVGIGTAGPVANLHVRKDQGDSTRVRVENGVNAGRSEFLAVSDTSSVSVDAFGSTYPFSPWTGNSGILTNNATDLILGTNALPRMVISSNGNVFINSLVGGVGVNYLGINNLTGMLLKLNPFLSDIRLKKNISPISEQVKVLEILEKLRGVYYNWDTSNDKAKDLGGERQIGMIAQEVEPYLPELVSTDSDGYKSLDYQKLVAFMVEVCKEQQKLIDVQEKNIIEMRRQLDEIRMFLKRR